MYFPYFIGIQCHVILSPYLAPDLSFLLLKVTFMEIRRLHKLGTVCVRHRPIVFQNTRNVPISLEFDLLSQNIFKSIVHYCEFQKGIEPDLATVCGNSNVRMNRLLPWMETQL
ncbi:hypothetical protein PHYBLDRAFT_58140 [Phycomyces blakesleeanus NRRL 1555(-)]|uniref:Uncharacterized protein n=1 Tax=Phycomyces blakesleeanus (strain ATCC 8743b / DSM 1359 / FGSC 10004 / NBRC 33097 / NRRL 1555) TaxID=763407 RepID=A0A163B9U6_PHYB8|nr:hypothetical protein PHYBLDRAFT_58140 [Phycomyces blakesleeanus NRRL 1555(-)]OAD79091.1 hypothetical protein PHYBLDRAFT_58140 [Phycomyces blakesleeanus NRRL 1555(-)]|eukprot:XP_018297131.1 hypothetical protein PHYBLDRAFT_58140 [Phycomyces blakesleeanus NRRL 1555(-)]